MRVLTRETIGLAVVVAGCAVGTLLLETPTGIIERLSFQLSHV